MSEKQDLYLHYKANNIRITIAIGKALDTDEDVIYLSTKRLTSRKERLIVQTGQWYTKQTISLIIHILEDFFNADEIRDRLVSGKKNKPPLNIQRRTNIKSLIKDL